MDDGPAESALATLVRTRGPALVRYAHLLTGDAAAAQDLVQDALVKVFVRTRARGAPEYLEPYVRRAITSLYLDSYRRRRTFAGVLHLVASPESVGGPERAVADRVDLRAALAALSPQERTVVVLRFYDDLGVAEVADRMGLAPGTVKRYTSDAVAKLERVLGPLPDLREDETVPVSPTTSRSE